METKRITKLLIMASLFYFLFSACRQEIPELPTISVTDAFASYTTFDSASYWVYERKLPEPGIDTIAIYQVWKDRRFHQDATTDGYFYNSYELFMESKGIGMIKGEIAVGTEADSIIMNGHYRIYFDNDRYFSIFIPRYPLGEVQFLGVNEGNYTNVALHDNMIVNGKTYQDVYHTHIVDYKNSPDTAFLEFYLAKDHGMIKYERRTNMDDSVEVWELKSDQLIPIPR